MNNPKHFEEFVNVVSEMRKAQEVYNDISTRSTKAVEEMVRLTNEVDKMIFEINNSKDDNTIDSQATYAVKPSMRQKLFYLCRWILSAFVMMPFMWLNEYLGFPSWLNLITIQIIGACIFWNIDRYIFKH